MKSGSPENSSTDVKPIAIMYTKEERRNLIRYIIFTYLLFWVLLGVTGFLLLALLLFIIHKTELLNTSNEN